MKSANETICFDLFLLIGINFLCTFRSLGILSGHSRRPHPGGRNQREDTWRAAVWSALEPAGAQNTFVTWRMHGAFCLRGDADTVSLWIHFRQRNRMQCQSVELVEWNAWNAYGMLYRMLTECLRNAYGMLTRLAIAWCQLREVPDAAASQVDKMSWVAGLAEARWFRAMDVSGSGTVERAGGTTSGVQAQEHWGERAWEGASFKWVQANKIQLAYLFAWVFGDQYTVSHIHTCCDCKQETERAKREYLYGEAANSKPCYRPIGLDRAQADWNTDARAILFFCFKSFSQKQDWHGHLHGVMCQVRAHSKLQNVPTGQGGSDRTRRSDAKSFRIQAKQFFWEHALCSDLCGWDS